MQQTVFLIRLAEKRLNEFLDKPYLKGVKVVPIIKHFSEISRVSKENNANLILMGSYRSEGLKEIFIGANTQKVVWHSDAPVLVIKDDTADFEPK
jgi:nucleotide-binding universal stress UspA family protein